MKTHSIEEILEREMSSLSYAKDLNPKTTVFGAYLDSIQYPDDFGKNIIKAKETVNEIRRLKAEDPHTHKNTISELKKSLPCIMTNGVFSERGDVNLIHPSGIMQVDVDGLSEQEMEDAREVIEQCPYTVAYFTSASGIGLKAFVLCEPNKDALAGSFSATQAYFAERGVEIDLSTKNKERLCYWSHSDVWIAENEVTEIEPVEVSEKLRPKSEQRGNLEVGEFDTRPEPIPTEHIEKCLSWISNKWGDKPNREGWLGLCGAVVDSTAGDVKLAVDLLEKYFPSSNKHDSAETVLYGRWQAVPWETVRKHLVGSGLDPLPPEMRFKNLLERDRGVYISTDIARAERFVEEYSQECKYSTSHGWLVRVGHLWEVESKESPRIVQRFTKLRKIIIDRADKRYEEGNLSKDKLNDIYRMVGTFSTKKTIKDGIALAQTFPEILIGSSDIDSDPWLAGAPNCILDLRTGKPTESDAIITRSLGCDFIPDAESPEWERFLIEIFQGDKELIRFIQKSVGYALTGDTREHCLFFFRGVGRNGKSVFLERVVEMLGTYSNRAAQTLYAKSRNGAQNINDVAHLHGARFVVAGETEKGVAMAESQIKDLTGGETVVGGFKYKEQFTFKPECKIFFSGNHEPAISGQDEGIWNRIRLVPFNRYFKPEERNKALPEILSNELTGILNWALKGCQLWQDEGLGIPKAVEKAVSKYRESEDTLAGFVSGHLVRGSAPSSTLKEVFAAYQEWTRETGVNRPLTDRGLAKELRSRGLETKNTKRGVAFIGIGLVKQDRILSTLFHRSR